MAVMQMQKISICALNKDRKEIMELLQHTGAVEVNAQLEDTGVFELINASEESGSCEKHAQVIEQALTIIQTYVPENSSMFSSFEGKQVIKIADFTQIASRHESIYQQAQSVIDAAKRVAEARASETKCENRLIALEPWMNLSVPLNYRGTKSTAAIIGAFHETLALDDIYTRLAENAPDIEAMDISIIYSGKDLTCIFAMCCRSQAVAFEDSLRASGFSRPSGLTDLLPAEEASGVKKEITTYQSEAAAAAEEIKAMSKCREDFKVTADYYRNQAAEHEALGQSYQSAQTFLITGFIPAASADKVKKSLEKKTAAISVDIEAVGEDEESPVLLKNNRFSEAFEDITHSFGLPTGDEFDPTTLMSFFYVFLFGLMLSDAAYGFLMFIVCLVLLKKFPNMETGMHKALKMFMFCGVSTMFWGVMFGSYFGDVFDVIAENYFHITLAENQSIIPALWFVPLNNPMKLLIYSMLFGLIHLFTGLGAKGYMLLRKGKVMDFVSDVLFWYMFLLGLVLMLLPTEMFSSMSQMTFNFPPAVLMLSKVMTIVGAVGILVMSGRRKKKNIPLRLALGAYDLYGITGWLSDVLSYSRLLALGLATGVIASVINMMGSMMGTGIVGTFAFILIFIVGHILNMAINLLGAYVHTNRLQYVEFFGKFYEGGGRAFNPFRTNTKYVNIKEDVQL